MYADTVGRSMDRPISDRISYCSKTSSQVGMVGMAPSRAAATTRLTGAPPGLAANRGIPCSFPVLGQVDENYARSSHPAVLP